MLIITLWLECIDICRSLYYSSLFYRPNLNYTVPYKDKEEKLIEILKEQEHTFINTNIFRKQTINKKYDIIILSNIIEYLLDFEDKEKEELFTNNLLELTEENGMIISSNIVCSNEERFIIDDYFNREDGPIRTIEYKGIETPISYKYIKKLTKNNY